MHCPFQGFLSLHGHVHESPIVSGSHVHQFEKTVAVNAGQVHDKLMFALIDIDGPTGQVGEVVPGSET